MQHTQSIKSGAKYKELFKCQQLDGLKEMLDSKNIGVNDLFPFYENGKTQVTLLHLAVEYNWKEGSKLLLEEGADVNLKAHSTVRNGEGSPIDWAKSQGKEEFAQFLEKNSDTQQVAQVSSNKPGR